MSLFVLLVRCCLFFASEECNELCSRTLRVRPYLRGGIKCDTAQFEQKDQT